MATMRSRGTTVDGSVSYGQSYSNKHAWATLGLGAIMLLIFIWGLMLQLQTSVAAMLRTGDVTLSFSNFQVFMYIPDMLSGKYPLGFAMAVFLAFAIECAYFAAIWFFDKSIHAIASSGWFMVRFWVVGLLLCVIYNMVSDYSIGTLGSGNWGHLAFALLMTFVESFFGLLGVELIKMGWRMS